MKSPQLKTPEEWADNSLMNSDGQGMDYYGIISLVESVREEFQKELFREFEQRAMISKGQDSEVKKFIWYAAANITKSFGT
jgi:hypothetical protein